MNLQFYLRFHTQFGESLWIGGNTEELGMGDPQRAIAMEYLNDQFWHVTVTMGKKDFPSGGILYKYFLKNRDNEFIGEWGMDKLIKTPPKDSTEIQLLDSWNHAGEFENAFFSAPFKNVLLPQSSEKGKTVKHHSHTFRVKAPLLAKHEEASIAGSGKTLGNWAQDKVVLLSKETDWWSVDLNLMEDTFPLAYKYGVYNTRENCFVKYESGDNRLLHADGPRHRVTILHDGFIRMPNNTWKGAGVSLPVFGLRSNNGLGVGEFMDLKLLVDWARETGLKLIQILPVNDTIATNTWVDSYPYAAISAFALHPLYINLTEISGKSHQSKNEVIARKAKQLNALTEVDYEEVLRFKMDVLRELYHEKGKECLDSNSYLAFFEDNKHWLEPYGAFCYLRDKYATSHFEEWKTHRVYDRKEITKLLSPKSASYGEIAFYFFVQFHLHLQLKEAVNYAHKKGVVLKGDIPIGIYRYGCDAWMAPELYNMEAQAGAPPDDFTPIGQNWGFPTYNWKRMQEDGFAWWKQRFGQMSNYFDAFRIDHILGFFRIWSIPEDSIQGIMGHFVPCIPVHYVEFGENGIWFDEKRYCHPFIIDEVLNEIFGDEASGIRQTYLLPNGIGGYDLKEEFNTQRKVEEHFLQLPDNEENRKVKLGLFDLLSNVLFFKQEGSRGQEFHFRISMEKTSSFRYLIPHVQEKLRALYVNYFFRRQDEFWKREALHKLPQLKASTNMLICGEDLGMVPGSVPEVMKQLGILSLEIQRMPKDIKKDFFYPHEAPYLSVITPSTHDMSTVRGWWEENREKTQHFYNHVLGQWGDAPYFCESWINRAIILQHLYSPAMWSIFQLQDLLGMSESLRRENPHEERINNPAIPKHYWRYRMHIPLEDLIRQKDFNEELKGYVVHSGR
jgi:4-alpha-glucanotransferase